MPLRPLSILFLLIVATPALAESDREVDRKAIQEARSLAKTGAVEEALEVLLRAGDGFEVALAKAEILEGAGRVDEALAAVATARERTAGSDLLARHRIFEAVMLEGRLRETKKQWEVAIAIYGEAREPLRCTPGPNVDRIVGMARCEWNLGRRGEAIDRLTDLEYGGWYTYFEYCARAGRLEEAKRRLGEIPEKSRRERTVMLAVAEAFTKRDAAGVIDAFARDFERRRRDDRLDAWTARLLAEIEEGVVEELSRRIVAGDRASIRLAGKTGLADLVPALAGRIEIEVDRSRRRELDRAVRQLGG